MTPESKLIEIDIDGTIINKDYQVTDLGIIKTIYDAQLIGWELGLSSDTPLEAMQLWKDRLGMNGYLIAEKGSIVQTKNGELILDENEVNAFAKSREELKDYLLDQNFVIWEGNPVEAIRDKLTIGNPGNAVVLINSLRRCSLGIFTRQVGEEGMKIDSVLTEEIAAIARGFYPHFSDIIEDLNHAFGLLIASRQINTKRRGTEILLKSLNLNPRIGMIGDSMTDFVGKDLAIQYAVSNASAEYREAADYVAKLPFASGVIEIISQLGS